MPRVTHPAEEAASSTSAYQNQTLALVTYFAALLIIYLVGLEASQQVHDVFHDVRHAFGFPCH